MIRLSRATRLLLVLLALLLVVWFAWQAVVFVQTMYFAPSASPCVAPSGEGCI